MNRHPPPNVSGPLSEPVPQPSLVYSATLFPMQNTASDPPEAVTPNQPPPPDEVAATLVWLNLAPANNLRGLVPVEHREGNAGTGVAFASRILHLPPPGRSRS